MFPRKLKNSHIQLQSPSKYPKYLDHKCLTRGGSHSPGHIKPLLPWTHRAETSNWKHDSQSRGKVVPSSQKCHWLRWALGRRWAVTAACDRDKQEQVGDLTCFSPSSHPREQLRSCLPRALKYYFELFASHYLIYLLKPDRGKGRQNFLKAFDVLFIKTGCSNWLKWLH